MADAARLHRMLSPWLVHPSPARGHELRRPYADYLRAGVHELRARVGRVNYRILYFFGDDEIILSHGFTKEREIPDAEIERARRHRSEALGHARRNAPWDDTARG
jgi:phage-related protein